MTKSRLRSSRMMLCFRWYWKRVVHYELPFRITIDSDIRSQQLTRFRQAIAKKNRSNLANRKGVVFYYDNARPYKFIFSYQAKIEKIEIKIFMYPLHNLVLAPSDYHLSLAGDYPAKSHLSFNLESFAKASNNPIVK